MVQGLYVGQTSAQLAIMLTEAMTARSKIMAAGQSYSLRERSFQQAQLSDLRLEIAEINFAIAQAGGALVREEVADMSGGAE